MMKWLGYRNRIYGKEEKFFHISCFFGSKQNPVAYINKKDKDIYENLCKSLGKYVFKEMKAQAMKK